MQIRNCVDRKRVVNVCKVELSKKVKLKSKTKAAKKDTNKKSHYIIVNELIVS